MTRRSDLVAAVAQAWSIVDEAIPTDPDDTDQWKRDAADLRAAALPVIIREILHAEVEDDRT